jgi:hypothetical protein
MLFPDPKCRRNIKTAMDSLFYGLLLHAVAGPKATSPPRTTLAFSTPRFSNHSMVLADLSIKDLAKQALAPQRW